MTRRALTVLVLMLALTAASWGAPPRPLPHDPVADAVARYAAYSMGTSPKVTKLEVTLGRTSWYYDAKGERLYRTERAKSPMGGVCPRSPKTRGVTPDQWATARVVARDQWGNDLYGPVKVVMQLHKGMWIGRLLGHTFADTELQNVGVDPKAITGLRNLGL